MTVQMLADLMIGIGRSVPIEILPERVLVRGIAAVFQQHFELSMASGQPGLSEKQTLVRRNPEIKGIATPSTRPNAHYWVLHDEEMVSCGGAVCLTNYSVNAAHADNSSA
jgi:hypothetical protein